MLQCVTSSKGRIEIKEFPTGFGMTMIQNALKIIEEYDLGNMVCWILENNPAQALPYHNFTHSLWVASNAYEAFRFDTNGSAPPRELIVAALFHDFDHSGGFFKNDSKNLERALTGYKKWVSEQNGVQCPAENQVEFLISETLQPLAELRGNFRDDARYCLMAHSLRDGDMMQNCNDTLLDNFVGVKNEMSRHDSYQEWTNTALHFLRSIKYETKYGQDIGIKKLQVAIEQLERFQKLVFG